MTAILKPVCLFLSLALIAGCAAAPAIQEADRPSSRIVRDNPPSPGTVSTDYDHFSEDIESDDFHGAFLLEEPVGLPVRGSILLVQGSGPFDVDGRTPAVGRTSRYGGEPFYLDLAGALRERGWCVLRYAKPGVGHEAVDEAMYARTDLALLGRQVQNLWRRLPDDGPRIVLAWSEGSLLVPMLPLNEIDGVVLLGAIATNIADVIAWQGGPSREALEGELAGKERCEMIDADRPAGRLADELALEDNWKAFEPFPDLSILVLHGGKDRDVPPSQARVWVEKLENRNLTVVVKDWLDHRFMPEGLYYLQTLTEPVLHWLDLVFPFHRSGDRGYGDYDVDATSGAS